MNHLHRLLTVASAAFFIGSSALAQNAGTVTNHAFAIGKGAGATGYTSMLCTSAQLAVGQAAADPICKTITGDVTISAAGVTAIGATKVTSAMLNADVFSTAHSWGGQQTFVAPVLGTPASGIATNLTGTASGLTAGTVTTNANLTGDVTSVGNATTLGNAPVIAKALTGFTSGAGTITAADSILSAFQKINGNDALKLPLAGGTMSGNIAMGGNAITGAGAITGTAITGTSYTGLPVATNAVQGVMEGDATTISCTAGVCSAIGGTATSVAPLTTTVTGGTNRALLGTTTSGCGSGSPCLAQVLTGQIPGTATNDSASAGNVGEYVTATASGVALSTSTFVNITSISLTAGDWDVTGQVQYTGNASTTVLRTETSVSSVSATAGIQASFYGASVTYFATVNGSGFGVSAPVTRFSLSATTTIYLVSNQSFGASTMAASGTIRARRVR